MVVVYGIPNCDTVKRARAWLVVHGVEHRFHDFKKQGLEAAQLEAWIATCGWQALLNRKGTTWRKHDAAAQQAVVDAASAADLMRVQTSVIKRPVVQWADGSTSVGFDATLWSSKHAAR